MMFFSDTYQRIQTQRNQKWNYERYGLVKEFQRVHARHSHAARGRHLHTLYPQMDVPEVQEMHLCGPYKTRYDCEYVCVYQYGLRTLSVSFHA